MLVLFAALAIVPMAGAWSWPTDGHVLQAFLFDELQPRLEGQHRGVDLGGEPGETVRAPASGVVTFVGNVAANGTTLTIDTPDGWTVTLTHLGSITVTKGAAVAEGDGVGTIGPTGEQEVGGAFVHLGVRRTDAPQGYIDPVALLPARGAAPAAPESPAPLEPAEATAV